MNWFCSTQLTPLFLIFESGGKSGVFWQKSGVGFKKLSGNTDGKFLLVRYSNGLLFQCWLF